MSESEKRIHLTIISSSGDLVGEFSANIKISALKIEAMARLKIDPSTAKNFSLVFEGKSLAEDKTLAELGIPDNAKLILEAEPEVI